MIVSEGRVFIHALRDIAPGEEITTDYLYELYSDQINCRCRTTACGETTSLVRIAKEFAEQESEAPAPFLDTYRKVP